MSKQFKLIIINTEGQAFEQTIEGEIARILRFSAMQIEHCNALDNTVNIIRDLNGNVVGSFDFH
jgi:Mg-chelatase subunit ChlD